MVKTETWDLFLEFFNVTGLPMVRGFQTWSFFEKFFEKFFLLKMTQNGPIRENKWLKSKISFLLKMTQNGSIREKKWSKSKFENFALPMGPWVPDLVIFCRFSKMKTLSIFSTLAGWICLILHIRVVPIVLDHLRIRNYLT